jgi:hypothetical protein
MRLEKDERNAIFDAVVAGGLDPRECTFVYGDDGGRVTHLASASYFDLSGNPAQYVATTVVGEGAERTSAPFSLLTLNQRVRGWASQVKRDVETPDKWAEIQGDAEILTGARYDDVENTPFTPAEQAQIAEQFEQIKRFAQTRYALSDDRVHMLDAKLDAILTASSRLGRKDWVLVFSGALLGLILTDLLPPSAAQNILVTVLHALEHLFGSGGGQHLPPPM